MSIYSPSVALVLAIFAFSAAAQEGPLDDPTMKTLDANNDGVVTEREFLRKIPDQEHWQRLDQDGDGILSAKEQAEAAGPKPRIRLRH